MQPTKLRQERQTILLKQLADNLYQGVSDDSLINIKALNRFLDFKAYSKDELFKDCYYNKSLSDAVAFAICKSAQRQGIKDEAMVFEYINKNSNHTVTNLGVNDKRYDGIDKSVDGSITGKYCGDIFGKIIVGKGGHQDNVWIELNSIAETVKAFPKDRIYCLLVDTDDMNNFLKLKQHQTDNVWIVDTHELIEKLS